ncbi:SSD domain-containing protein [Aphelenchoides besseyi]|nr:SSD domain-containing protein [Aphelenchoides besseyi]
MGAPLEGLVRNLTAKLASIVAKCPLPFVIIPLLLTCGFGFGIQRNYHIIRGVQYLYSPDAEWKIEEQAFRSVWAVDDERFYPGKDVLFRRGVYLIVSAKDGGNVLRPAHCEQMISLLDTIANSTHYADVCFHFQNQCFQNSHIRLLAQMFLQETEPNITYPLYSANFLTEPLDLNAVLGGVDLNSNGYVLEAKAWLLVYQLKQGTLELRQFSSFGITFAILIILSVIWTFILMRTNDGSFVIDWVQSKPLLGIAGVFSTLMAIISGIGALLCIGIEFPDIVRVMPFLCLTIGVDDCFLLIAEWRNTDRRQSMEVRLVSTMQHAGTSIAITSLTDALAFLIGSIASLPAVYYFCLYASLSIVFIYLYTITFFCACLAFQGKWENANCHSVFGTKTISTIKCCEDSIEKHFQMGSRPAPIGKRTEIWYQRFFADKFAHFLCRSEVQILTLLSFMFYLRNIVTDGSSTKRFLNLRSEIFPEEKLQLDVAVLRPPNMANEHERNEFLSDLSILESNSCCKGRNQTDFWYFKYERYIQELGFGEIAKESDLDYETFRTNLSPFLMSYSKYAYDIVENENGSLEYFRLSIGLVNFQTDAHLLKCATEIRELCKKSQFKMISYSSLWNLADQFAIMWPQTMQDIFVSVVVMVVIALLFISPPFCSLIIGLSIVSVSFGVLGFMSLLKVKLDATSMISIAMSVGFSVDFAAHVSYAFCSTASDLLPHEQLRSALKSVCWPITQASTAVLLGMITLGTVNSYIVQTCFKTVILKMSTEQWADSKWKTQTEKWEQIAKGDLLDDSLNEFLSVNKGLHAFSENAGIPLTEDSYRAQVVLINAALIHQLEGVHHHTSTKRFQDLFHKFDLVISQSASLRTSPSLVEFQRYAKSCLYYRLGDYLLTPMHDIIDQTQFITALCAYALALDYLCRGSTSHDISTAAEAFNLPNRLIRNLLTGDTHESAVLPFVQADALERVRGLEIPKIDVKKLLAQIWQVRRQSVFLKRFLWIRAQVKFDDDDFLDNLNERFQLIIYRMSAYQEMQFLHFKIGDRLFSYPPHFQTGVNNKFVKIWSIVNVLLDFGDYRRDKNSDQITFVSTLEEARLNITYESDKNNLAKSAAYLWSKIKKQNLNQELNPQLDQDINQDTRQLIVDLFLRYTGTVITNHSASVTQHSALFPPLQPLDRTTEMDLCDHMYYLLAQNAARQTDYTTAEMNVLSISDKSQYKDAAQSLLSRIRQVSSKNGSPNSFGSFQMIDDINFTAVDALEEGSFDDTFLTCNINTTASSDQTLNLDDTAVGTMNVPKHNDDLTEAERKEISAVLDQYMEIARLNIAHLKSFIAAQQAKNVPIPNTEIKSGSP